MKEKIGLIAAKGKLPYYWAKNAVKNNKIYTFKLSENNYPLNDYSEKLFKQDIGQLEQLIQRCLEYNIKRIVFAGKVEKNNLYKIEMDLRMKKLLNSLDKLSDDNILRAIAAEFESEGIEVRAQSDFVSELLAKRGKLTSNRINKKLLTEMEFAFLKAKELGKLDIGQSLLTKNKAVVAVEAMEGTDQCILRAGKIAGNETIMAKVAKAEQDLRFDIPTVGLKTIENLAKIKAKALILEAGKTFILEKVQFLKQAEEAGIAVWAVSYETGGVRWEK